jgi:HPt (histidine-containing phosphotransfer) domain-containing protein
MHSAATKPTLPPLKSAFANDGDMLEIIKSFVDEMPSRVETLLDLWEKQQLDELRRAAHQLSGASGGYGFAELGDAAKAFEATLTSLANGATAATMADLRRQFDHFVTLCSRVTM